ncbi:MAG: DUF2892 domain-containing protein, partial [Sedimenticolaceae bacterium]
ARRIQFNNRSQPMKLFKYNMGKTDRIIRAVLGVLLIGNVFFALQHPVGWIGVILLATAIVGVCPLYSLLGLNTKSGAEKIGLK